MLQDCLHKQRKELLKWCRQFKHPSCVMKAQRTALDTGAPPSCTAFMNRLHVQEMMPLPSGLFVQAWCQPDAHG